MWPGPSRVPSERGPPTSEPDGLGARVDCPLGNTLGGAVLAILRSPPHERDGVTAPLSGDLGPEKNDVFGLCFETVFSLSLIAVSCMTLRSSFHCAMGKRCFPARALNVARVLGLDAKAAWIAILN